MSTLTDIKKSAVQLYPTGRAWNFIRTNETQELVVTFTDGAGEDFTDGVGGIFELSTGSKNGFGKVVFMAEMESMARMIDDIRSILDSKYPDNDGFDEVDASNWERVLGLFTSDLTLEERKTAIARKRAYPNGITQRAYYLFIQEQLRAAGFDVYVHENRFYDGAGGWEIRDPDVLESEAYQFGFGEFGEAEFGGGTDGISYTIAANYIDESKDAVFFDVDQVTPQFGDVELADFEMKNAEIQNRDILLRATFFVGGASFPSLATVPPNRKKEFRQLVLSLKHTHTIAFLLINYI